jgi:hypothetical protein
MAAMRRMACDEMVKCLANKKSLIGPIKPIVPMDAIAPIKSRESIAATKAKNVANSLARDYYLQRGISTIVKAMERQSKNDKSSSIRIMECRHCLRYALGHCVRHGHTPPTWKEPLELVMSDKRRFTLEFDCGNCQMNVYAQQ